MAKFRTTTWPIGNTAGPFSDTTQRLELFRFAAEILVTLNAETPFQISKGKPDQVVITQHGADGRG